MSTRNDSKSKLYSRLRVTAATVLAVIALALGVAPAHAHTRVEIGPYSLVLGWQNEPVIVGERNALVLEIVEGQAPVEGLEGSLTLTVFYGGESFIGQLAPSGTPGVYTAEIFPTVRGQYEVQLTGEIGEEVVDVILEPEAVLPADVLQFPEPQPDPNALAAEVERLEDSLDRQRALAVLGLVIGSAGLLLGATGVFLSLKQRGAFDARE